MDQKDTSRIIVSSGDESLNNNTLVSKPIFLRFFLDFGKYLGLRSRQFSLFGMAAFLSFSDWLSDIKGWSVRRMYWGRSSFYRTFFHIMIFVITIVSLLIGISGRINVFKDEQDNGLVLATGVVGNNDVIYQAGSPETISANNPNEKNWPEYKHVVKQGETLESIAKEYGVSESTIRWANNFYSPKVRVDQVLIVPGLDGVLYTVQDGDTVDSIVKKVSNANAFDIQELNELQPPDFKMKKGQQIFIPNGVIIVQNTKKKPINTNGTYIKLSDSGIDVPSGTFISPLPGCAYNYSRGVTGWHTGVDLAKKGGCWIYSSSGGRVVSAGWGTHGEGFHVKIDHLNGFMTYYYHGNGEFTVKEGDMVKAGQRIMYMGTTGNSTGVHLHFEMRYNGNVVNPEKYVRLR